uniref:tRNA (guanine(9)-N(1))-methyltransferase n=1 Tax=Syphacia muris TaxID=451379 RepID=A0A0N5AES0_9BILA
MKINAEEYTERKRMRRALEKQRKKARREAAKSAGVVLPKKATKTNMSASNSKQRIAIDMSFYDKMSIRDVNRTISQLSFCYAANRRAKNPTQLTIAHLDGLQKQMFFSNETRHGWDVHIKEETLAELFESDSIVYLTADSENVVKTLDESKVYVIGGLLDHNSYKNLCLHVAQKQNFAHARLPIDEYVKLNSRKVLTINQVFEILLQYIETGSWEDAFFKVIPKRKLEQGQNERTGESEIPLNNDNNSFKNNDNTTSSIESKTVQPNVSLSSETGATTTESKNSGTSQ